MRGRTYPEQHLGGDVVGRAHQRVGQAALVLPGLPALQWLQAVGAAAVGRVLPVLAEVHAVLSDVVPWRKEEESIAEHLVRLGGCIGQVVLPFD